MYNNNPHKNDIQTLTDVKINDLQEGQVLVFENGFFVNKDASFSGGGSGEAGKSAYEIWLEAGNTGTVDDFLQSLVGPQGNTGNDGNSIELRKTNTSIEWRQVPHKIITVDFDANKTMKTVKANDVLDKIVINSYPKKAKYAQIKTITVFGANANGEDLVNSNPSIDTAPEGTTFPEFSGFDPVTSGPIDLTVNPEMIGNANIKTIIDTYLPQLSKINPEVTQVNKITFWVYFLDENQEELKHVQARCNIIQNTVEAINADNEWKELIPLSAINGKDGRDGLQGPKGDPGEKGEKGDPGEIPNIDHLATKEYVTEAINGVNANNHSHINQADVLDKLSVVDGKLNFDNAPIQSEITSIDANIVTENTDKQFISERQKQDLADIVTAPVDTEYGIHNYYIRKVSDTEFESFTDNHLGEKLDAKIAKAIEFGNNGYDLYVHYEVPFTELPTTISITGTLKESDQFVIGSPVGAQRKDFSVIQISKNGTTLKWNTSSVPNGVQFQITIFYKKNTLDARAAVDLSNYYTKNETYNKTEVNGLIEKNSGNMDSFPNKDVLLNFNTKGDVVDFEPMPNAYLDMLTKYSNLESRLSQLETVLKNKPELISESK